MQQVGVKIAIAFMLVGCSSADGESADQQQAAGGAGTKQPTTAATVKLTVTVPDDFDGFPERIDIVFFETAEVEETPYAFGDGFPEPDLGPGNAYALESSQAGLDGSYYMAVVLYCEGGGAGEDPVPGVDWAGMTEHPVTLSPTSGTVDAGELELTPFEGFTD